jgi:hypothetical protein
MRLKSPATYILLLILVCFMSGVVSVLIRPDRIFEPFKRNDNFQASPTTLSANPSPVSSTNGAITILILGVDHIADPEGKLLAIWLLTFTPPEKQITLIGLPVNLSLGDDQSTLEDLFDLWIPPSYGAGFIQRVSDLTGSPIRGFAVLDEHGFAVLLDFFGGVELDGQAMDGTSVIGSLRLTYANPQAALRLQAQILDALRLKASTIGRTPELTTLTSLSPIHAYTSPSPPELTTLAIPLLPLDPEQILIELWSQDP